MQDLDNSLEQVAPSGESAATEQDVDGPTAVVASERLDLAAANDSALAVECDAARARLQRDAGVVQWLWDETAQRFLSGLPERAALLGLTEEAYLKRCASPDAWLSAIHPRDREHYAEHYARGLSSRQHFQIEFREETAGGAYRHFREYGQAFESDAGDRLLVAGMTSDITEHKLIEARVAESEALLRQAADMAQLGHWVWDEIESRSVYCSETLAEMFEVTPEVYLQKYATLESLLELIHPGDRERCARVMAEASENGTGYDIEYRERMPDGGYRYLRERGEPVLDADGQVLNFVGTLQDITHYKETEALLRRARDELQAGILRRTEQLKASNAELRREVVERQQAERALRLSRDRLRLIADNLPALIMYADSETRYRFINSTGARWHKRPADEILGKTVAEINAANYMRIKPKIDSVLAGETFVFETRLSYDDGKTRDIRAAYVPHRDDSDAVCGFFVLAEDITKDKSTERALLNAQKMEAVGQLSGGAAHDFNNLLEVILGNAELLAGAPEDGRELVAGIQRAGRLAKDLTQRLLAFSRQQPLEPRAFDLAELIGNTDQLLKRTLGANITIVRRAPANLWPVMADPGQVENALLNLALNARDAMPKGGRLTIEAANAQPDDKGLADLPGLRDGDFVVLTVSDDGEGMSEEVLARATEPFFTTKDLGQGTGLGLSMVYGFAQQSGGHLSLSSRPGVGTSLRLYLPRAAGKTASGVARKELDVPAGHGESILLVEDDAEVRDLLVRMLEGLGYRVTAVGDAAAALEDLQGELDGTALARRIRRSSPATRLIFMTGYSPMAAGANGIDVAGAQLLRKPFSKMDLALKLSEVLAA